MVRAEDGEDYLLPSAFGLPERTMQAINLDLNVVEMRVSRLEDMIAERIQTKH